MLLISQPVMPLANRAWYDKKPDYTFSQIFSEAWSAFEQGRDGRAITLLKLAGRRWPRHPLAPFALYMEAKLYMWRGDGVAAAGSMRRFLALYPGDPNAPEVRRWLFMLDSALGGYGPDVVRTFLRLYDEAERVVPCRRVLDFIGRFPGFPGNGMLARLSYHCILAGKDADRLSGYLPGDVIRPVVAQIYRDGHVVRALKVSRGVVRLLIVTDILLRLAFWLLVVLGSFVAWRRPEKWHSGVCNGILRWTGQGDLRSGQDDGFGSRVLYCIRILALLAGSWALVAWDSRSFGLAYAITLWTVRPSVSWTMLGALLALARYAVLMML